MEAILFSLPPTNPFTYICPPPYRTPSSPSLTTKRRIRIQVPFAKPHKKPTNVFPFGSHSSSISFPQASGSSKFENPGAISAVEAASSSNSEYPEEESLLEDCSSLNSQFPDKKSLNLIVHYANFGSCILKCIAKPMVKDNVKGGEAIRLSTKGHEYSDCTRRLLETVSGLLKSIEEVRRGNGDIKEVEAAWKAVQSKKEELQRGIMSELYVQVKELRREKVELEKRAEEIVDEVVTAKREYERLVMKGQEEGKERVERLEENLKGLEEEYNRAWGRVGEIEDGIARREFVVMSFAMRELCFVERECEQLVGRFTREMRQKGTASLPESSVTKLSKSDIQKDLESAQRRRLEQIILPSILESEDVGPLFYRESVDFSQHEVLKGFPEVELKWMFGNKEVVVPKAINLHLYHGWKKWREEAKADLKRNLLANVDFGKQYVAQRQEHILLDRDRVVSKTWYDEEKNRWEMDPVAVPYAVSKKLVEHARIRHDWAAMYIALKGDDKEYFVDIKEFEMLFEEFGGFDGLYMKMLACGIPTTVHLSWIPFSELDFRQQFLLTMRLSRQCFNGLWKSKIVSYARDWVLRKIKNINDDVMMMIVFPTVEFIIPYPVRMQLGMAWPEEINQTVGSTWYLKWQSEAEMNFKSRKTDDTKWFLWFFVRTIIYGFVLFHVIQFMKRKIPRLLGYGPLRRDPNLWKLRRVKAYLKQRVRRIKHKKKAGIDPIKTAFDRMKRVKNPPIPLKDFASIESMREEMNEVVAFLQNPSAFQEMGARAPRGVLIVVGGWTRVGQSASNVRELFQTARDLAPVIIFVEDFDLFAGVRGKFIHTKNQDHEAFINQLLVELDGFEKQDGVVLMATTRNLKQIDEALQRPGRMDRVFHLQRPTQVEREKILQTAAKETMDNELIDLVDWGKVAEKTALLRPIELKLVPVALEGGAFRGKFLDTDELLSYCGWFATFSSIVPKWVRKTKFVNTVSKLLVNHLGLTLTKEDLQNVVDLMEPYGQITNGIELLNPPLDWTRETKFPHAVWAAGRGLIALLLPNFDVVDNLWLEPLSWQGIGCTKITKARNEGSMNGNSESRSYLEKKLVFALAQEIATRMVIQYGWGPDDSPAIYYHSNAVTALSMGNNHEYEMAAKVEKMYDLAYYKAEEMLQKNRQVLGKIVEELLEFEILTRKDLERMVEDYGGIQEKEPFFLSKSCDTEWYSALEPVTQVEFIYPTIILTGLHLTLTL
ncbi:hypothetical protein SLA2020_495780 [Shorea laevis]